MIAPLIPPAKPGGNKRTVKCACRQIDLEIVKRSDAGKFVVLPKR